MLAFSRLCHRLLLENRARGRALGSLPSPLVREQSAGDSAPGSARSPLLPLPDRPAALAGRTVPQRRRPGGRAARGLCASGAPGHPHQLSDAELVAPQAAAPATSAKRRPGAPPRGFLPRPPFPLQVVGCQGEKSLLAGWVASRQSVKAATFAPALRFPSFGGAWVAALGVRKKQRGFLTTLLP